MKREITEEKIQDLIDGKLSEVEAKAVKSEIEKDEYLTLFYQTLKEVDSSLHHHLELSHPSDNFTSNVMSRLHSPRTSFFDYRSLLIFLGIVICAAVGLIYSSQANLTLPDIAPVKTEVPVLDQVQMPGIDMPSMNVMLNVFYFGLLFMALIYFDRVILKQLFRSNRYSA